LRELVTRAKGRIKPEIPSVIAGVSHVDGKVAAISAANDSAIVQGATASVVMKAMLGPLGGRGGGKDDMAQGGGTDVSKMDDALAAVLTQMGDLPVS
jgi:alanyl-tRNA synthetase